MGPSAQEDTTDGAVSSGDESPPQQPFVPSVLQRAPQVRVRDTGQSMLASDDIRRSVTQYHWLLVTFE